MLNYIWAALMIVSFFSALLTGRMQELSQAILTGAQDAVVLTGAMLGMMCLWTGLMKIAEEGGMTSVLSRAFFPLLTKLFPEYTKDSAAMKAICMNLTANLLGLGNAATPLGIAAMKEMAKDNGRSPVASDSMVLFVVMNTAAFQLIPATVGGLRSEHGAQAPFDILPAVWMTSLLALLLGICMAKLLSRSKVEKLTPQKGLRS